MRNTVVVAAAVDYGLLLVLGQNGQTAVVSAAAAVVVAVAVEDQPAAVVEGLVEVDVAVVVGL